MTPHQKKMFAQRLKEFDAQMPGYRRAFRTLEKRIVEHGGEAVVVPPWPCDALPMLLDGGDVMSGPIQLQMGQRSACHDNVNKRWAQGRIHAIGTGFGLSDDGLWREHSWGVRKNGTIVETTEERIAYYGVKLTGDVAMNWVMA